jgi:hypothetical protein
MSGLEEQRDVKDTTERLAQMEGGKASKSGDNFDRRDFLRRGAFEIRSKKSAEPYILVRGACSSRTVQAPTWIWRRKTQSNWLYRRKAMRARIMVAPDGSQQVALADARVSKFIVGSPAKVVFLQGRFLSFVTQAHLV